MLEIVYYLKGLELVNGSVSTKIHVRGRDYNEECFYGDFDKNNVHEGMLEVRIISFVSNTDEAWIIPATGTFVGREYGIKVNKKYVEKRRIETK